MTLTNGQNGKPLTASPVAWHVTRLIASVILLSAATLTLLTWQWEPLTISLVPLAATISF